MSLYRSPGSYRQEASYQGHDGVFQKPLLGRSIGVSFGQRSGVGESLVANWGELGQLATKKTQFWKTGLGLAGDHLLSWLAGSAVLSSVSVLHKASMAADSLSSFDWAASFAAGRVAHVDWQRADSLAPLSFSFSWSKTYRADAVFLSRYLMTSCRFESEFYQNSGFYGDFWGYQVKRYSLALSGIKITSWGGASAKSSSDVLPWGGGFFVWGTDKPLEWTDDPSPVPDQPAPAEPNIEDCYFMATDLTAVDVATRTPLSIEDVRISLDIDSFSWGLSAKVMNRASMALAGPGALVEVSTMGWSWVFLMESYSVQRGVANEWVIKGSSQSKELGSPWLDGSSFISVAALTWRQAIEEVLPVGWLVEFDSRVVDYSIPAGAWSYTDKTPKEVLSDLLEAVGCVAIPNMATKSIFIQARYKYAPWEYYLSTTEPDVILHESMVLSEGGQYHPAVQHNSVWVGGNTRHGVLVEGVRTGSNGLPQASDFYHELITDSDAGWHKAKQILSGGGPKGVISLDTIITDEQANPGLIIPGMLIEVRSSAESWRGVVLSTSIAGAGSPEITQTLSIERDYGDYS